jgi:hypothetical protein
MERMRTGHLQRTCEILSANACAVVKVVYDGGEKTKLTPKDLEIVSTVDMPADHPGLHRYCKRIVSAVPHTHTHT